MIVPRHATGAVPRVEWRQLRQYLWAGAGMHGPVGTIEQGHRFTAIDTDGGVVGRCKSLQDAQALLEHWFPRLPAW